MKESEIQKSIIDYLGYRGYLVIKFNSVGIYKKDTGQYIPQRQLGVADLLVCSPKGEFLAIEVKRPGGKPTEHQKVFLDRVKSLGGRAFIATSIDDVERELKI